MPDSSDDRTAPDAVPIVLDQGSVELDSPVDELMPLPASLFTPDGDEPRASALATPEFIDEGNDTSTSYLTGLRPRRARRGDVIGNRYVIEGQIGRGGMGRILRVRHQVLGKGFALKLIRERKATDVRTCEMFYREARLASSLSHDNICSIVDFGNDPAFGLFMVMELLEGVTILDKLEADGPMAVKAACAVMRQVADAVHYIHGRSIVHGDVKSDNILLADTPAQRRVKLLDFGLARIDIGGVTRTLEGTPEYLAPECVQGQAATPRSDIYALGVLFYELLVGKHPFRGDMDEVLRRQVEEPFPRLAQVLGADADSRADALIARATAKNPALRHQDVAGFLYELQTLMDMLGMDGGRRRRQKDAAAGARRRGRSATRRTQGAAEVFDYAPIPLAAVDGDGKVRVANEAFLEFLGVAGDAAGIELAHSLLPDVYPQVLDDLNYVASSRSPVTRVITLHAHGEGVVEVAVILSAVPSRATVTAGDVIMALHPLSRAGSAGSG
jgi:eukaryotic-like serine/threonine-protein kinase